MLDPSPTRPAPAEKTPASGQPSLHQCAVAAVALLAALLIGLGLVFAVAANWDAFGRSGKFACLQAVVLAPLAASAAARGGARAALALLGFVAIGGLLAFFGQTYRTGADPWQLFALWSLPGLLMALALRHDALWAATVLVASTAIALWQQTHTGFSWRMEPQDASVQALSLAAIWAIALLLSGRLRRWTGSGAWSLRLAVLLACLASVLLGIVSVVSDTSPAMAWLCVALLGAAATVFASRAAFDLFAVSAIALSVDALLVAWIARWLLRGGDSSIGTLSVLTLVAAAVLAITVHFVMSLARRRGTPPRVGTIRKTPSADLPPDASSMLAGERPWPVLLLAALGGWLTAIPLLALLAALFDVIGSGALIAYAIAATLLLAATLILRRPDRPIFVQQLALPVLLAGLALLGARLSEDWSLPVGLTLAGVATLVLAWLTRPAWLHAMLGFIATSCLALGFERSTAASAGALPSTWLVAHAMLALLLPAFAWDRGLRGEPALTPAAPRDARDPVASHASRGAAASEGPSTINALVDGGVAATLATLVIASGSTFLLPSQLGPSALGIWSSLARPEMRWVSAALAVTAAMWVFGALAPANRRPAWAVIASVACALSWFVPTLGAILWIGAWMARRGRRALAGAAAVAALWAVGAFYYALDWTLMRKAAVMIVCGAVLGLCAWTLRSGRDHRTASGCKALRPATGSRSRSDTATATATAVATASGSAVPATAATAITSAPAAPAPCGTRRRAASLAPVLAAASVLALVNTGIYRNESSIANGRPIFIELAPADPRSLMQGDYMRLDYATAHGALTTIQVPSLRAGQRPRIQAQVDARGIARLGAIANPSADDSPGPADGIPIELAPSHGRWTIASDAWFFREGEAERWQAARYGEFRISPAGRPLLVGLRGPNLKPL